MKFLNRWEMAYSTHLGTILLFLILVLFSLVIVYLILRYFQRKNDLLKFLHHTYYEKAEKLAKGYTFLKKPKAGFFGRQSVVKTEDGFALCIIPPPDLAFEKVRENFNCIYQLAHLFPYSCFSTYSWIHTEKSFITIQKGLFRSNGHPFLNISHYLKDKKLSEQDKEKILLTLATDLSSLHQLKTENGENLYHGFLIPQVIFLDVDVFQHIHKIVVMHLGKAFSMQSKLLFCRLEALKKGNVHIEKYEAQQILEQLPMLAPEQKDFDRLNDVGFCSDFYAFGSLAAYLFTEKWFVNKEEVDWTLIPLKWHPFLKSSLSNEVSKRPRDFLELLDWLNDLELLNTTHTQLQIEKIDDNKCTHNHLEENEEEFPPHHLSDLVFTVRGLTAENSLNVQEEKTTQILYPAMKAIRLSKWEEAKSHFEEITTRYPENSLAHLHFAIFSFETGDIRNAEKQYQLAINKDPSLAKKFREHIALLGRS